MSYHPAPLRTSDPLHIVANFRAEELAHEAAQDRLVRRTRAAGIPAITRPALAVWRLGRSFWCAARRALVNVLGQIRVTGTPVVPWDQ